MAEKPTAALNRKRNVLLAIGAVCVPLAWVSLMIWSPVVLGLSEKVAKPISSVIDQALAGKSEVPGMLLVWPLLFGAIVIHEVGHLFIGLCAGFKLTSMRVWSLHFSPPFRFYWKSEPRTGASGWVRMIPGRIENLRVRAILFVVAGPLANLVTAYMALHFFRENQASAIFACISFLIGIANLVPFQKLSLTSDGKRIAMLLFNKARGERWVALMQLAAESTQGVGHKNLSPAFIAKAIAVKDNASDTVLGHMFAYAAAYENADIEEPARLFEVCLAHSMFVSPAIRDVLRADASVFQARKRGRIDLAEQWLAEIPAKTSFPGLQERAQAGILEAQGDFDGAIEKLAEVEKKLNMIQDPYQRSLSLRSLQKWKLELAEKQSKNKEDETNSAPQPV